MSPVSYHLDLPLQWKIHPVFHIDLLSPYRETEVHGRNYQHPPPELIDNEEEYEVESILDLRRTGRGRKLQYLIKWKGYPDADNQWEDYRNVTTDDLIRQFQRCNPAKETHLRRLQTGKSLSNCSMSSPTPLNSNSSDIIITFITCNRCGSTSDYCHCTNDTSTPHDDRAPSRTTPSLFPPSLNPSKKPEPCSLRLNLVESRPTAPILLESSWATQQKSERSAWMKETNEWRMDQILIVRRRMDSLRRSFLTAPVARKEESIVTAQSDAPEEQKNRVSSSGRSAPASLTVTSR
jgi:hypothetical protein